MSYLRAVQLSEPMTLATDYVLGLLSLYFAWRMTDRGAVRARRYWVGAFAACGVAALFGGTHHGFLPYLGSGVATVVWKITLYAIGWAAFEAGLATVRTHLAVAMQRPLQRLLVAQLVIYLFAATGTDEFLVAIIDYSVLFCFVLGVHLRAWLRNRDGAAAWIVAGVLTSFAGAAVQAAGLAPHAHFNHNDLYHVIQMAGTWMLYRGASRTSDPLNE